MTLPAVLTALLAGAATAVLIPGGAHRRLADVFGCGGRGRADAADPAEHGSLATRPGAVLAAAGVCGVGVAVLVGGLVGVLLGAGAAAAAVTVLHRLEPAAVRRRRERVAADLPTAVDLLGACLCAGRPPADALPTVAGAIGGPLADDLRVVTVRLELGADPVAVWRELGTHAGPLAALGRTMARSLQTGAPMADGLRLLASDLRSRRRAAAEQQAHSVGVRAAAPLGLCFLPAFVLIGIVPAVAAAFGAMSWW